MTVRRSASRWAERDPVAAARLARVRTVVAHLADSWRMPTENLLQPEALRRLAWSPPTVVDEMSVADALRRSGARDWQVGAVAAPLAAALPAPLAAVLPAPVADQASAGPPGAG